MELVPKTKYTHFRSESLSSTDDTNSNPSLPNSAPLTPLTPPGMSSSLSSTSLTAILPPSSPRPAENSPTTFCSFFPRMGALRLGVSATLLPGLKAGSRPQLPPEPEGPPEEPPPPPPEPAPPLTAASPSPRPLPQDMNRQGGAPRRARVEGGQLGGDEWTRNGSFVNKPTRGWLHADTVLSGAGVSYSVRYMGCVEVLQSMRALDFNTRTQVTREAITVVCEAVPGARGTQHRRKGPSRCLSILGKSNLQFAGMAITLTVSTSSLNLLASSCKQIIANHHMQSISFASGGDPDTEEYVAYVAKDPVNQRACHVLECPEGTAQEVIGTIGQAFELRFKQYLKNPPKLVAPHDRMAPFDGSAWEEEEEEDEVVPAPEVAYYNDFPGKLPPLGGLVDMRCHATGPTLPYGQPGQTDGHKQPFPPMTGSLDDPSYVNVEKPRPPPLAVNESFDDGTTVPPLARQLQREPWFHGSLSRRQAERLLGRDGDFLVRESGTTPGQYVLTGQQGGQPKHLLLVDPEGVVRTKHHRFESVSHLITYHMDNRLPIVSAGSEVCLQRPVERVP
ncbi:SHC-transforming protein 1-like isoform X2 [Anguilla anguilla]|uniref:SHC-transforming protein 1-like isoform X2 n=1 Tax=Anguilla anguilla TaxID=7936 RepID=UPI0015B348CD|nr:SHC-transforming protein 1-like isoform X2 [Anguilla anguilla]